MSAAQLGMRVAKVGRLQVLLPLQGAAEAQFRETGQAAPAPANVYWLDADARDDKGSLGLFSLFLALWPAGVERMEEKRARSLDVDNRLDAETELCEWADRLMVLLRWAAENEMLGRASLGIIEREFPELAALLRLPLQGVELCELRSGRAVEELFDGAFPELAVAEREADAEDWAAWQGRSEEEIFGERGGLAALLAEAYEPRQGQLDMAVRIRQVLKRGEHAMVEAGTGIGKSLAYLVPSLLHGARQRERVVISTHTKALQAQLMQSDLPLLSRLGYPGKFRLLLGRNNYLCRRQLRRALGARPDSAQEALAKLALRIWAAQSSAGRQAELSDHPWYEEFWRHHFESIEPCSPHICHPEPSCFVVRARRSAREAPVIVVNHALLMMDLKSAQSLMGPSKLLIVDEAHQLPDVALRALSRRITRERADIYRNLLGDRIGAGKLREVPQRLRTAGEKLDRPRAASLAERGDAQFERFVHSFSACFGAIEAQARERLGEHAHRAGSHRYHDGGEAFGGLRDLCADLLAQADAFDASLAALVAEAGVLLELGATVDEEHEGLASLLEFHREFGDTLRFAFEADDEDWVYWFEWRGEAGLGAIVAAPLTVEEPFAALWDQHYDSVVLTSATLAVGEDFMAFAEAVGMSKVARYTDSLVVPSPFDFERQALILTAGDLPQPNAPEFAAQIASLLHEVLSHRTTKILTLCTSYRFITQLSERLHELAEDLIAAARPSKHYEILAQQPGQARAHLADRFRRAESAVLLATGSFWEGVDFPGRELELLVVPRLPFAVPTEPLIEGRFERARRLGRDPFEDVALADAVLRLKQGVGRLLRSANDRGAVLLLDQRLQSKAYGVSFLKSLPRSCELVAELKDAAPRILEFLGAPAKQGRAR